MFSLLIVAAVAALEYTRLGHVSLLDKTQLDFDQFYSDLEALEKARNATEHGRSLVREALTLHLFPRLVIQPKEPTDGLYNVEHEHRKEVWGHKCVKDFLLKDGRTVFAKEDMAAWFKSSSDGVPQPLILDFCNAIIIS